MRNGAATATNVPSKLCACAQRS